MARFSCNSSSSLSMAKSSPAGTSKSLSSEAAGVGSFSAFALPLPLALTLPVMEGLVSVLRGRLAGRALSKSSSSTSCELSDPVYIGARE
jgi:hypothetical protein